jgi:(p)ppGpp synthase/HD superfamily hydrolase
MDRVLEQIRDFADRAHGDQKRKYADERYIAHPLRVMETCSEFTSDITILAAALLHDVVEDTDTTKDDIHEFLVGIMDEKKAAKTVSIVEELTDQYTKKKYPLLNRYKRKAKEHERLGKTSADAQMIKYADLIDNTSDVTDNDPEFAPRYIAEAKDILRRMKKGNFRLRQRALTVVEECETKLNAGTSSLSQV